MNSSKYETVLNLILTVFAVKTTESNHLSIYFLNATLKITF